MCIRDRTKNVSDDTARRIDEVVRIILDKAYARTTQILTGNMDKLHAMAEALLTYETIDARQIDAIMEGREPDPPADWGKGGDSKPKTDSDPAPGLPLGPAAPQP